MFDGAFRTNRVLASSGQRGFGGAGGAVGVRGHGQRGVQPGGGTAMEGLGLVQGFQGFRSQRSDACRRGFQRHVFGLGLLPAGRQVGDPLPRIACPFRPSAAFRSDRALALHPCGVFPDQGVAGTARGRFAGAGGGQRGARLLDGGAQCGDVGQSGVGVPRLRQNGGGFVVFHRHTGDLLVRECQAGRRRRGLIAQRDQRRPRAFQPLFRFPPRLPRVLFGGIGRPSVRFGGRASLPRCGRFLFRRGQLGAQIGQPVPLPKAHGRRRRGAGADGVTVPSPDCPGAGDQNLPGRQGGLPCVPRPIVIHQSDLRQCSAEHRRRLHKPVQCGRAFRQ